ncbi:MAG: type II toxin-antitoxin system HicB family antitoxin [Methanotrichaceae archaeon]
MNKYAIEIIYSEKANGYIAVAPELPGCSAFGETEEEALKEIKDAIGVWICYAEVEKRDAPKPRGDELIETIYKSFSKEGKRDNRACSNSS